MMQKVSFREELPRAGLLSFLKMLKLRGMYLFGVSSSLLGQSVWFLWLL